METCSSHGNDVIHMRNKFNLPIASLSSEEEKKAICRSKNMWLSWKHVVLMEIM